MATSFSKGKAVIIRNPDAIRPWQYVLDALNGYLILAMKNYQEPDKYSGAWNFGPNGNSVRTVSDFTKQFSKAWGSGRMKVNRETEKHEDQVLMLDSSKSRRMLGWASRLSFEELIKVTAKWYKQYYEKNDMLQESRKLIKDYIS